MQQIDNYIANANHPDLLKELRELLKDNVELMEEYKWNMPVYIMNGKDVCYLKDTKSGVNLGFTNAKKLADVTGILEGIGKDMRHIKVTSANKSNLELEIKSLIQDAVANARTLK